MATADQIIKYKGAGPVLSQWPRHIDNPHGVIRDYSPWPDLRKYTMGIDVRQLANGDCVGFFNNFSEAWSREAKEMLEKIELHYNEDYDRLESYQPVDAADGWKLEKVVVRLGETHGVPGIHKWLKDELRWSHPVKGDYMTFYDWPAV